MKALVFLPLLLLATIPVTHADENKQFWIWDRSKPGVLRLADWWAACKIVVTSDKVSFLREADGKLVEYWSSNDPKTAATVKQVIGMAPSALVQVGESEFINIRFVTSVDFEENSCTFRVGNVTVGTVNDANKLDTVWKMLGHTGPRK